MKPVRTPHRVSISAVARVRPLALALLGVVGLLAVACGGSSSGTATPGPDAGWYGGILGTPGDKPAFTLTDTAGRPFDFQQDTAGTVTLLFFGYTHCPDVCPTHMAIIASALKDAGPDIASKVKVVFVTTDPERDTGPVIREWLDHFSTDFIGLTGTPDEIAAAELADGLPPAEKTPLDGGGYAVSHAAWVTVFAQDNKAYLIYPLGIAQEEWVHDLTKLVQHGWSPT